MEDLIRNAAERGTQQTSQQPFKSNREIRGVREGLGCYLHMSRSRYRSKVNNKQQPANTRLGISWDLQTF
jgi:hypothetical protein